MIPPEPQPRSFRPYISSSVSAHSFSSTSCFNNFSANPNPNRSDAGPSSRRSLNNKTSRFSPAISFFAHNSRIAVALLPCAAFLLNLGGIPIVATLTVGLMISYILDSLNFKYGAFVRVWLSPLFSHIAFLFSSLSSRSSSFNSLPLSFFAAISAVSSYYLRAFHCLFYWLYSIPRLSSFKTNHVQAKFHDGQAPDDSFILGPLESCFHTLNLIFLPLLFHIASRRAEIVISHYIKN